MGHIRNATVITCTMFVADPEWNGILYTACRHIISGMRKHANTDLKPEIQDYTMFYPSYNTTAILGHCKQNFCLPDFIWTFHKSQDWTYVQSSFTKKAQVDFT